MTDLQRQCSIFVLIYTVHTYRYTSTDITVDQYKIKPQKPSTIKAFQVFLLSVALF